MCNVSAGVSKTSGRTCGRRRTAKVRKDDVQWEGKDVDKNVDTESMRDSTGGEGREGEGGREGGRSHKRS